MWSLTKFIELIELMTIIVIIAVSNISIFDIPTVLAKKINYAIMISFFVQTKLYAVTAL